MGKSLISVCTGCRSLFLVVLCDGRKLRQQEFQEKRELLEFTESQLNQLTYEIKEEIKQHTEEVERKVCISV